MRRKRKIIAYLLSMALMLTSLPVQLFSQTTNDLPLPMSTLVDTQTTTPGAIQINPNKYIGDGYEVEFKVTNQWTGAFNGEFVLTNTSDKPLENWTLTFDFEHEITNIWGAQIISHEGNAYIIKNATYNQDIAIGESVTIGFSANWDDEIKVPESYDLLIVKQEVGDTDYTIDFKVTGDWGQAFNGEISITNNTEKAIEDWTLEFDFDREITSFWTASIEEHKDEHYVIKNAGYNANIGPGQTIILGFAGNPGNVDNEPVNYVLNQLGQEIDDEEDTDKDGLPDFYEKLLGTNYSKADSDGDGLSDGYEYLWCKTDPLLADSDGDEILDLDEDLDEDGLNNLEEYKLHTNPLERDTDYDGLTDYDEINETLTNPILYDTDEDGLSDGDEVELGLDPNNRTTHDGILDSEYCIEQHIDEETLAEINEENSIYSMEVDIVAVGNAKKQLVANESDMATAIENNRAVVGKVVSLVYSQKVDSAKLRFKLKDDYLNNMDSMFEDEVFQSIERYQVFRFDKDKNLLYPIETEFSSTENTLTANVTQLGDYCIIDMEAWLFDLGILEDYSKESRAIECFVAQASEEDELGFTNNEVIEYIDITNEELEDILGADNENNERMLFSLSKQVQINKQADLVFIVDTTGSMSGYIASVKSQIANVINYLREQNITLHVAFIEYRDITCDGIDSTKLKSVNGKAWLNNSSDMINVLQQFEVNGGGDWAETPIEGLAMATELDYRSEAHKFVVLVTDAGYKVNNSHGITSLSEIAEKLQANGIYTCVAGASSEYNALYTQTGGIGLNISNFTTDLDEFIMSTMMNKKGDTYLDSIDLMPGTLIAPLAKDSSIDSDRDTIPDCEEVDWEYITIEDNEINVITLGELLDKLKDTNSSILGRFSELLSNKQRETLVRTSYSRDVVAREQNEIMGMGVLMAGRKNGTSALKIDSDGDTFIDCDDPRMGDDKADRFNGVDFCICSQKDGIDNTYFKVNSAQEVIRDKSLRNRDEFRFVWTGKAYKIYSVKNPNMVLSCNGDFVEISKEKINDSAQLWQIIPQKYSYAYMMKSLYNGSSLPRGGKYVDSEYTDSELIYLDEDAYNTSNIYLSDANAAAEWLTFDQIVYRVKNGTINTDLVEAFNRYYANKGTLKGYNTFINGKDLIQQQGKEPFNRIYLGNRDMGYNGCEVIATYNALLLKNQDVDILKLACEFEANALIINPGDKGGFGSESAKIDGCLDHYNISYVETKSKEKMYEELVFNDKVVILSYWHESMEDGIHTVAMKYNPTTSKITVYNWKGTADVSSIDDVTNRVIRAYCIG